MPIKILMPALSPTMTEGNLAKWLKKEGDKIEPGEVIAEIETDKATMEVEAVDEGVLAKIVVSQGAKDVAVNSLIAVLLEEDEKVDNLDEFISKHTAAASPDKPSIQDTNTAKKEEVATTIDAKDQANKLANISPATKQKPVSTPSSSGRIFASPLAKRIAAMENIDLTNIIGSGPRGRIVKADVLAAGQNKHRIVRHPQEYRIVENNNIRQIIAKRLIESKQNVPHFYLSIECLMDNIVTARAQINASFADKSKKISVNDFVIMAVAKALKEVPEANASWSNEAILYYNNVDVSVAVAIDNGLITPIIKNADQKDLQTISSEMKDLALRARENKLSPEEFQGGGFSISNLGMYGIKSFSAIINPPQSCILAVGASSKRALVIDNQIIMATVMDVTLSCDHRVVDGAVGARFLAAFKKYIESPILMFIG
ncbi:MAG: pyruvate dehydrogenase complex dihydrolipoamide acetyltransferase [Rickettsiaceae bacterium]|nr:pyruvate dehydrogenase complex dihydrolipoamide acetyltransferase [Rickettsiaceae bacterium]